MPGPKRHDVGFLIVESDLRGRFPKVEEYCKESTVMLDLQLTLFNNAPFKTILRRFREIKKIKANYHELCEDFTHLNILFVSNSEGYIAKNICSWLKRQYPRLKIISLQHGMYCYSTNKSKEFVVSIINFITKVFIDFEFFGVGFANKSVDAFVVYNSEDKKKTIKRGIGHRPVYISSATLRGDLSISPPKREKICLFVMQPLSALGITTTTHESMLLGLIIKWLSKEYGSVLIKQHPYGEVALYDLPNNCGITKSTINELGQRVSVAFSFYSTALKELEYFGVKTTAIHSKHFKVNKILYDNFSEILSFDDASSPRIIKKISPDMHYYETHIQMEDLIFDALKL